MLKDIVRFEDGKPARPHWNGCLVKERFKTFEQAHQALPKAGGRMSSNSKVDVYRCNYCGFYHVGNSRRQ